MIFKSPKESNKCPFYGGVVSFASEGRGGLDVRLSYEKSDARPRNDIVELSTGAGTLSVSGRGEFRLVPREANGGWRALDDLRGERLRARDGEELSAALERPGHVVVRATDGRHRLVFAGTLLPKDGLVYVRDAAFTSVVPAYAGRSLHDCGNWGDAEDAAAALRRVEAAIPP